jgi:ubiquinone/menaquinone biosynthesis C-methylase UbiE
VLLKAMPPSSTFLSTDGDGYEAQMGRWSRRLAPLLIAFSGVTAARRVLDVGCGTGSLTFEIARRLGSGVVTGIDFSPVYIEHASRRNENPCITFEVGDACALRFEDASFDHAFSSLVLQFIPDADRAVREMRRVTRPSGTITAATWDTRGGVVVQRMFFDSAAVLDPNASTRRAMACMRPMSRADGLRKAWSDAGLVDVVQGSLTIRMEYESFADLWSSIDGNDGPYADYLRTLAAEAKLRLRRLIEAAYLDGEQDGPRSYAATAWAIKGRVP